MALSKVRKHMRQDRAIEAAYLTLKTAVTGHVSTRMLTIPQFFLIMSINHGTV